MYGLAIPTLDELPFLKSLCWQGQTASIAGLAEDEILSLYERGWRYRGVMADLGETEKVWLQTLAAKHHSWLVNEI